MDEDFEKNMEKIEEIFKQVSKEIGGDGRKIELENFGVFWERVSDQKYYNGSDFFNSMKNISDQLLKKTECTNPIIQGIFLKST